MLDSGARQLSRELALAILIIDDERRIRRFLCMALEGLGCRTLEAGTGEAGLNLVETQHPDLVLLDLGLPDRDGIEVARSIREHSRVPILVISARTHEQSKAQAFAAGWTTTW
ncbi:MAG: response regulator [Candidatus Eisenbacteria bacterium]|nr:response regulator [Candidatus Eisenbacteria bacterium]